jgi:perosamine synthetase
MLPYGRQSVDAADIEAVTATLRSDWLTTGPGVEAFEDAFAHAVQARFAVAVSSGTAALHAAVYAASLTAGDEAVVPPLTFAATANCVLYQGATVRFADVRRDTLNVDPAAVRASITPKTRAIIAVDYTGLPVDLQEVRDIAERSGATLIEDACHALGAEYRGRPIGSMGHLTVFSLHPVKLMTTGEGGVVTTNDEALARRLRLFRNHGLSTDHRQREAAGSWFYEMVDLGYNYRITDFQCALGRSQLRKLVPWIESRRRIARAYDEAFASMPEIELPARVPDRESAWHLYVIRLNLDRLRAGRLEVFNALRAERIGVNVHYIPVPWHPYYATRGYRKGCWPVAEAAYERILSLPIFPAMTEADTQDVISAVQKVVAFFRK